MILEQLNIHILKTPKPPKTKMNLNLHFTSYTKINQTDNRQENKKIIKLLEENMRVTLYDFGLSNGPLNLIQKAQMIKEK